jgi:hypothetical protein
MIVNELTFIDLGYLIVRDKYRENGARMAALDIYVV